MGKGAILMQLVRHIILIEELTRRPEHHQPTNHCMVGVGGWDCETHRGVATEELPSIIEEGLTGRTRELRDHRQRQPSHKGAPEAEQRHGAVNLVAVNLVAVNLV